jgi:hypothetical protein
VVAVVVAVAVAVVVGVVVVVAVAVGVTRLRWRALEAISHEWRCSQCGGAVIVQSDDDGEPMLACRMHRAAPVAARRE